jgi:hypothetical protein
MQKRQMLTMRLGAMMDNGNATPIRIPLFDLKAIVIIKQQEQWEI